MEDLAGYTVAVLSERRRHELANLLEAASARVVNIQAVRSVAQPVTQQLIAATQSCVARPVHEVIVSSGLGLRAWLRVVRQTDSLDAVLARFADARLLARDGEAADTLRDLGLRQIWATSSATTDGLFRYLLAQPIVGRRIVAQIESEPHREYCSALRRHGASVVEVVTNRFLPPLRVDILRRLCAVINRRQVDAVVFTGVTSVDNLLRQADADGMLGLVLNALATDVAPMCLGELAAARLKDHGVSSYVAPSPALPNAVIALAELLPGRVIQLVIQGHHVQVRSQALAIGRHVVPMQPGPIAVLRALADRPGRVLSPAEIRAASPAWEGVNDHAVEMAVSRLRRILGNTPLAGIDLVQTVMRRGYRLAVSPRTAALGG